MIGCRLLADERGDDFGKTAEFDVEDIVDRFSRAATDGEGNFAGRLDGDVDEPRLRRWSNKEEFYFLGGGKNVHEEVWGEAIRDVGRQVEVVVPDSSLWGTRGNLPSQRVNENVDRLGKGRTALNVVVADETEDAMLGKDRRLVINGAIAEPEHEAEVTRLP